MEQESARQNRNGCVSRTVVTVVTGSNRGVLYPDAEVDAGSIPFYKSSCCEGSALPRKGLARTSIAPFFEACEGFG